MRPWRIGKKADCYTPLAKAKAVTDDPPYNPGLPDNHPAEVLAREFEEESRKLGLHPGQRTPRHIAERRARRIQEVLGLNIKTGEISK